ncbi:GRM8 [Mytilus edulis]|uniref:GRM8 n=2 Tax=Mytilus edulis TaxID=6550 RepID=A0A8S3S8N9_MYTED|nr:GRM8 [Mytilus edulis]
MHEKQQGEDRCGKIKKEKGIQRLEAMLFAVKRINDDIDILPGIPIGVHILDTCSSDTYALEQCMDFIKAQMTTIDITDYKCDNGETPLYNPIKPVVGVIGAASSTVSIMVANILRLFKIPQISYASTSIDLSDKSRYEYFSRVVPPDSYQAQAMVDIAEYFSWNYVITIQDEGNYGDKGIGAFKERATLSGICIAKSFVISRDPTKDLFKETVDDLFKIKKAKVIVMFVNEDNAKHLLEAVMHANKTSELWFLASDSWGAKVHPVVGQEKAAEGAITLLPKRSDIREFDDYFSNLTLKNNKQNLWFEEYWGEVYNCSKRDIKRHNCTKHRYEQEGLVQFVIDSVYALAHALHNYFKSKCTTVMEHCPLLNSPNRQELLEFIRNVSFTGIAGDIVEFNSQGDGIGRYDVYQYQKLSTDGYGYVKIGEWIDRLKLNSSFLNWKEADPNEVPNSVCSEPCTFGHKKEKVEREHAACCWICIPCGPNQYLVDEKTCKDCEDGFQPSDNVTSCKPLPLLELEWNSLWVILPIAFSSFGIVSTILTIAVFIKFNNTPIIMASGRELCYVLLVGILMAYGTSLIMLATPTIILCTIIRLGLGVSLCLIYAAMLTKTNRIYRIFNNGIKAMVKRPSYTSPKSQIIICMALVSVQIVGGLTWLGFEKPDTIYTRQHTEFQVLKCKASQIAIIASLTYNIVLIILCTIYGIKTRKIPQNFNEAKCIAFTMYSTCIVWLAFGAIYFGASSDFKIEVTSLCMCVSISATVALVCVFVPKLYIVLLQPHKNVRQGASMYNNSYKSGRQNSFGSFPLPCPNGNLFNNLNANTQITQTTYNDVFSDDMDDLSCDEDANVNNNSTQTGNPENHSE